MNFLRRIQTRRVPVAILHTAAWLVPAVQRREWLAEWKAELWHVCDSCERKQEGCPDDMQQATMFCLGAFKDAFWLRREHPASTFSEIFQMGSPSRCIALLVGLATITVLLAGFLPGVRKVILPSPYSNPQNLVLISPSGHTADPFPSIPLENFQSWKDNTHELFNGMAFYRPIVARLRLGRHQDSKMSVALASDNLFQVLGVAADFYIPNSKNQVNAERLVLSHSAWKKYFHGDRNIAGKMLQVAGQKAIVVGVIDDSLWRLPGRMDAYLLEDAHAMAGVAVEGRWIRGCRCEAIRFSTSVQRSMANVGSGSGHWCWKLRLRFPDRTKQAADVLFFLCARSRLSHVAGNHFSAVRGVHGEFRSLSRGK